MDVCAPVAGPVMGKRRQERDGRFGGFGKPSERHRFEPHDGMTSWIATAAFRGLASSRLHYFSVHVTIARRHLGIDLASLGGW